VALPVAPSLRYWFKLSVIFFVVQLAVRLLFIVERTPDSLLLVDVLASGFVWDAWCWSLLSLPLLLLSLLIPPRYFQRWVKGPWENLAIFIFTFIVSFVGVCEIVFWMEFHSRFNFIAIDYLIYTNEVLANLRESFPMGWITLAVALVSVVATFGVQKIKWREGGNSQRKYALFLALFIPLLGFIISPALDSHQPLFHESQLGRNGFIEFARAFRSNKIDYNHFYAQISSELAQRIHADKKVPLSPLPFEFKLHKPNVVIIVVESLGAKFIAPLGGQSDTTPYLNKLADESLFFENLYSSGTRTVRGLEAITLSIPPTPGYAVVKRPDHTGLYSMGLTFKNNGYDPIFLYGGNGFFDNMNSFFSGNQFEIVDQSAFSKDETTFTNAWGVCDEDLFKKANRIAGERKSDKPFLLFMLTTSNHRPFTYPEGKIDIASGTSRKGAVKYTDFAIGQFLEKAKKQKWAENTVFVVLADHSTEGRGYFELEMRDFHIPMWIYSPKALAPQKFAKLGSQIDLLPSLIHLLHLKDDSPFFGQSLFNTNWKDERAFIGNYQFVGYYRDQVLTTLGPNKVVRTFSYDPKTHQQKDLSNETFKDEAISYYQMASGMLDSGKFKALGPHPTKL
jgi:phosphoglycerol transferase MdoB-like AlkP superfamily enzyme